MSNEVCPKTWLAESILATIFCCLPFGIAGIVNASKVSSFYEQGRYSEALNASNEAKKWCEVSLIIGLIVGVVYLIIAVVAEV